MYIYLGIYRIWMYEYIYIHDIWAILDILDSIMAHVTGWAHVKICYVGLLGSLAGQPGLENQLFAKKSIPDIWTSNYIVVLVVVLFLWCRWFCEMVSNQKTLFQAHRWQFDIPTCILRRYWSGFALWPAHWRSSCLPGENSRLDLTNVATYDSKGGPFGSQWMTQQWYYISVFGTGRQ